VQQMTDAKIPKWDGQKENGTGRKEKKWEG
jgi:hypothetical protein